MVWQKYLAILTGSQAKSLSLVVAVFLLGLAAGFYFFGLLTENKNRSRHTLLKYYGYVELLTGAYIGFFPHYFYLLKKFSFNTPDFLMLDIITALLALLPPTFLMGAGIPMLTACLPDTAKQVNQIHAKVYGWNTLGACLGALLSGVYLIPKLGLPISLSLLGLINCLASLIFIGNKLKGGVIKQNKPISLSSPFPRSLFFAFVFFIGSLSISMEVLLVKILNLSIGAGAYNFPIILSIFVGALAYGSLSLKNQKININFFIRQLFFVLLLLQIVFYTAPYWSIWLNHIRISMVTLPSNYLIYFTFVFLFLMIFIFPPVFFMGRLLPLSYMFLKKNEKDYGAVCGFLYFFNTLGSFFGALLVGYLAFYLFDLDVIFKINLYLLILFVMIFVFIQKNKWNYLILSLLALLLLLQPKSWNRQGHKRALFHTQSYRPDTHFKSLFYLPEETDSGFIFFKDGPNTTVSLLQIPFNDRFPQSLNKIKNLFSFKEDKLSSYSIFVNGKSDGNTLGDFSTTFFMLPYLYSKEKKNLSTAFIGLGTGISAGAYTPLKDVESIDVLEISPFVIKAIQSIPPKLNFNAMKHRKIKIIESDAFKYFTKSNKKYDIIVSEPSNPWVMGVENLYTEEFYGLIAENLNPEGVFAQWLHTYSINNSILEIAIKTIHQVFPYAALYRVGRGDILIVAGLSPLKKLSQSKFNQGFIKSVYSSLGIRQVEDLYLSQILYSEGFRGIARLSLEIPNSLYFPKIIYRANKTFFLSSKAHVYNLNYKYYHLKSNTKTDKMKAFERLKSENWENRCINYSGFNFLCQELRDVISIYKKLTESKNYNERFKSYLQLRHKEFIPYSLETINEFIKESLEKKNKNHFNIINLINELLSVQNYGLASQTILAFKNEKNIDEKLYQELEKDIQLAVTAHQKLKNLSKYELQIKPLSKSIEI